MRDAMAGRPLGNVALTWDDLLAGLTTEKTGRAGVSAPVIPALGTALTDHTGRTTPMLSMTPHPCDIAPGVH